MDEYDAIVVGAGISGLVAANVLQDRGHKVLVLEKNNKIGGLANNTVKGRFEFKYPMLNLYIDNNKFPYSIDNIIDNKIEFVKLNKLFRVYSPKSDITLDSNKQNAIDLLCSLAPDSEESVKNLLDLAYECKDALNYIATKADKLDMDFIKSEFNNFVRVASYSVSEVMDSLGVPIFVQEIINSYWMLYGSSETSIAFVDYASNLVNALDYGLRVPVDGSYGVALALADNFCVKGGEIKLNSEVCNIMIENNTVNAVKLTDGKIIYCNRVIVNSTLDTVYSKLIKPEEVPREALRNINSREAGAKLFTVNLGLNRSIADLGITNYLSFIYHSLDSDVEMDKMSEMGFRDLIALIPNVVNPDASPEGTTVISLNSLFFKDAFAMYTDKNNYYRDEEETAQRMIEVFENYTKIKISNYIEEIEIKSPVDVSLATNNLDGNVFGFRLEGLDNYLPKVFNKDNEKYIKGLEVCGGFDGDFYAYNSNIYAGYRAAIELEKAGE